MAAPTTALLLAARLRAAVAAGGGCGASSSPLCVRLLRRRQLREPSSSSSFSFSFAFRRSVALPLFAAGPTFSTASAPIRPSVPSPLSAASASALTVLYAATGLAVAMPLIAIGQGGGSLLEHRRKHANPPRARSPSRGVVSVYDAEEDDEDDIGAGASSGAVAGAATPVNVSARQSRWSSLLPGRSLPSVPASGTASAADQHPPLRLLVIGDSLALGIGQSHSATPVLPESMARVLSRKMGGRAVCWTCHGKPGLTAAQLVREIEVWSAEEEEEEAASGDSDGAGEREGGNDNDLYEMMRSNLVHTHGRNHDPSLTGNYDLIVVMIGMGDLKGAALPFLRVNDHENHGEQPTAGTFRGDLVRVVERLGERGMFRWRESLRGGDEQGRRETLVVFPALPAKPPPIFRRPPLKWFVLPLVEYIDSDKAGLAADYFSAAPPPSSTTSTASTHAAHAPSPLPYSDEITVSFAPEPTSAAFLQWEDGVGPLRDESREEIARYSVSDMQTGEREELERRMRGHWGRPGDGEGEGESSRGGHAGGSAARRRCGGGVSPGVCGSAVDEDGSAVTAVNAGWDGLSMTIAGYLRHPGATVVSADDIHPNDSGYDLWGRSIASEVLELGWWSSMTEATAPGGGGQRGGIKTGNGRER